MGIILFKINNFFNSRLNNNFSQGKQGVTLELMIEHDKHLAQVLKSK
jgi:hypothetical protein